MKNNNLKLKHDLKHFKQCLVQQFLEKTDILVLTQQLCDFIDNLLTTLFLENKLNESNDIALLAVGSYGRQELQLYSDVDLLILCSNETTCIKAQVLIQDCWDVGLDISHQTVTVAQCADLASTNLSTISTLLDMRLIQGNPNWVEELNYAIHSLQMWPSREFFFEKKQEQQLRYKKYDETAFNLEPNIKYGPGGLRDLQILLSIAKRHFSIKDFKEGINCQFINEKEYETLINCQHFLWQVRFGLHSCAEKQEERLLFDYQIKLAQWFDFEDSEHSLAIEQFMKTYFKVIKQIRELNEILLQSFEEMIIYNQQQQIISLDAYFQLSNNFIEVKHHLVFSNNPSQLINLFLWLARSPTIRGVRAATIRLIRQSLALINKEFRTDSRVIRSFIALFQGRNNNPFTALQYMNKYGVLGRYLDCFAAVTGQMQYDLFHVYTVDQHTLFVVRNLVRFLDKKYNQSFPLAALLMTTIKKRSILYLAALYHDIAKGRGGDHSKLGAIEAALFAKTHRLSAAGSELLVWLVENHLLMSQTAQRQDIYDPKIIQQFCNKLPQAYYLDYLYLLTVADICATNQHLWNSWKDSLLKELYQNAKLAFKQKQALLDEDKLIISCRHIALGILLEQGFEESNIQKVWGNFKGKYFLQETAEIVAMHTAAILNSTEFPLVLVFSHPTKGGSEVFIYMPHQKNRFAVTTTILSNLQVTIQEASIITCNDEFVLDTYIVLEEVSQEPLNESRQSQIKNYLYQALNRVKKKKPFLVKRRLSRRQAHFTSTPPNISFIDNNDTPHTCLFLVAADRPGLLATISHIFSELNVVLHNAKVVTAGERAEDMFYISNNQGQPLSSEEQLNILEKLLSNLASI